MAKDKILKQKVYHDGTSMIVLKEGASHPVPDRLRQIFIDEGVIEGKTSKEIAKEAALASAVDPEDGGNGDAPIFTARHVAGGLFEITGPGLDQPERVKGKTEVEVRIVELTDAHKAALAAGNGDAPI